MPKISEMTLEQLQDYALQLEQDVASKNTLIKEKDNKIADLSEVNLGLQKRNNALFMQVEQQGTPGGDGEQKPEPAPLSCEDFAKQNYKEFIK